MADLNKLSDAVAQVAAFMTPSKRRAIMGALAKALRTINTKRMLAETDPEGDAWEARKNPPRRPGSKKMMAGLRRQLKATSGADFAAVGFSGRTGKIAAIHHHGLMAAVSPEGPRVQYATRQLIGIADGDLDALEEVVRQYIN